MHTGFIVKNTFMNVHYCRLNEDKELDLLALISLVIFLRSFASKIIERIQFCMLGFSYFFLLIYSRIQSLRSHLVQISH